jgi:hypothetical protein
MSKAEKLLLRMLTKPNDFNYSELKTVMRIFGYIEMQGSGSRVCFRKNAHNIKLHKPHPGNILKKYQLDLVIEELKKQGLI